MVTQYIGPATSQIDGSRMQHYNCVAAQAKTLLNTASLGFYNPSTTTLRTASGASAYTGITYDAIDRAVYTVTNGAVNFTVRYWSPNSFLEDLIDQGRKVAISIYTGVTRPYEDYRTGTFVGRHCVGVYAKRIARWRTPDGLWHSQKQGLVMDPGHSTARFVWWPWNLILRAANASAGSGQIHVYYTADLKGSNRTVRVDVATRYSPSMSADKTGVARGGSTVDLIQTGKGGRWYYGTRSGTGWAKIGVHKWLPGWGVKPH
jgi:hypothetical protein